MPIEGTILIIEYNDKIRNNCKISKVFIEVDKGKCLEDEKDKNKKYYPALYLKTGKPECILVEVDIDHKIVIDNNNNPADLSWAKTGAKIKINIDPNKINDQNNPSSPQKGECLGYIEYNLIENIQILNNR